MGEFDGVLYGSAPDWSVLDMGEVVRLSLFFIPHKAKEGA
jgi:hypothetical protein